jgi:hypothetical protein
VMHSLEQENFEMRSKRLCIGDESLLSKNRGHWRERTATDPPPISATCPFMDSR